MQSIAFRILKGCELKYERLCLALPSAIIALHNACHTLVESILLAIGVTSSKCR